MKISECNKFPAIGIHVDYPVDRLVLKDLRFVQLNHSIVISAEKLRAGEVK